MENLIIKDEEFTEYGSEILKLASYLENCFCEIVDVLDVVTNDGIKGGVMHDNLVCFTNKLKGIKSEISFIGKEADSNTRDYLQAIDDIDCSLY